MLVDLVLRIKFAAQMSCTVRFLALFLRSFLRFVNFPENSIKNHFISLFLYDIVITFSAFLIFLLV